MNVVKTATLRTASTHIQFSNDKRVLFFKPLFVTTAPKGTSSPTAGELEELQWQEKTRSIDRTADVGNTVRSPRGNYMFRPFSIRPSSGLTWWKP